MEKRLRSVKLQAGKARSFKEYQARLNELRSSYAMAEYHRFTGDISRVSRETEGCNDRITGLRTDIDRNEADESQVTLKLDALGEQINHADNEVVRAKSNLAAQEERIEASRRRAEEQQAQRTRGVERLQSDARRLEEDQDELTQIQESVVDLQRQTHELHARIAELNEQDRSLARDLTQAQAILEDEKAGIIDLLRKSAQTHNEITRLNTHRESLVGQKGRLALRDVQIAGELESALEQKAQFQRRLHEVEALIVEESRRLDEKKLESARVHDMRQRLMDELANTKERRSALFSRRDLLNDLQQKMDGVGEGVRKLLDEKQREDRHPALNSIVGLVADLLDTAVQYAPIIEAV
ncbi:MAG: hypothetical protein AAB328_04720, partial [candidate division NC10 bacterium]